MQDCSEELKKRGSSIQALGVWLGPEGSNGEPRALGLGFRSPEAEKLSEFSILISTVCEILQLFCSEQCYDSITAVSRYANQAID